MPLSLNAERHFLLLRLQLITAEHGPYIACWRIYAPDTGTHCPQRL
jgi:hypothetical protein